MTKKNNQTVKTKPQPQQTPPPRRPPNQGQSVSKGSKKK